MEKKPGFLEKTAQIFDIPGETVGLPRVVVTGRHELRVSNHRGILAYAPEEITVSAGSLLIKIRGEGLELRAMTAGELLITGTVDAVELT